MLICRSVGGHSTECGMRSGARLRFSLCAMRCGAVQDQMGLLDRVERDTEGVMTRVSASMHKMKDVVKRMNTCAQMGIIAVLMVVLIVMVWYTFAT